MVSLASIAARIAVHLRRFESDPEINTRRARSRMLRFYHVAAARVGRYVAVVYISYQGRKCLTRAEALAYLAWLDAGHVGQHTQMVREERPNA